MQFDVKIRKVIENGKPLKAVASVTVDGAFVIHNVRVIETENAKFVAMPYATYGCFVANKRALPVTVTMPNPAGKNTHSPCLRVTAFTRHSPLTFNKATKL